MARKGSGHAGRNLSIVLGFVVLAGVLQFSAMPARALISESFESGWGAWTWNYNFQLAYFTGQISSTYAHDGLYSVELGCHGLPQPTYPKMTVWVVRTVQVNPLTTVNVGVDFWMMSVNTLGVSAEVLAYLDVPEPLDYSDFTPIGQTEQSMGWIHYSYSNSFMSGPTGLIYAAVGYWNPRTGTMNGYFDAVNLTGVSTDWTPPTITNLRPTNSTIIGSNKPLVGANYSDASGIDTGSVLLKVDGTDQTGFSQIAPAGVKYIPQTALTEGLHTAYVEVKDDSENHNKAAETWRFTVDTLPPSFVNIQPLSGSTIDDRFPYIAADYSDASGVNASTVMMTVDGIDVTSAATVTVNGASYVPSSALLDGAHTVFLNASDNSFPANTGVARWSFTIDATPPAITNLKPSASSTVGTNRPLIGASYSDASGIALSSVIITLDSLNVTATSVVTSSDVAYVPLSDLSEGRHDVSVEVRDVTPLHLRATRSWFFIVDTLGPTITNMRPANNTVIGMATPAIAANYNDASGIDTATVKLDVDSVNVTSSATVTTGGVTYTPAASLVEGNHDIYLEVRDSSPGHNLATASWSFVTDTKPPTTLLTVGTPMHSDVSNGRKYITSQTELNLTADDHGGIGVQSVKYLFYASGESEPVIYDPYITPFRIPSSKSDGLIIVKFKGIDSFGNEEIPQTVELYLDNTPPASSVPGWDPVEVTYTNNALAPISVSADDGGGSGVGQIMYGIDDTMCPLTYTGAIVADRLGEGLHRFYFKALDNVSNGMAEAYIRVFLDTIAPDADAGGDMKVGSGTTAHLNASASRDNVGGSGIVNYTWTFTYQGHGVTLYGATPTFSFIETGTCAVTLNVRDRAGNANSTVITLTSESTSGGGSPTGDVTVLAVALALIIAVVLAVILLFASKRKKKKDTEEEKDADE